MKNIFFATAILAISVTACNSNDHNSGSGDDHMKTDRVKTAVQQSTIDSATAPTASIREIVDGYLLLKNALTTDNTKAAATAATALETNIKSFDKTALTADQQKVFADVEDDAREHAEHIGKNGGNIAHQREHFDMLSKDMYDLLKSVGNGGQTLYKDFCPMYNDNKGAFWISEAKEIKNPYLGNAMPTCGIMKEKIK